MGTRYLSGQKISLSPTAKINRFSDEELQALVGRIFTDRSDLNRLDLVRYANPIQRSDLVDRASTIRVHLPGQPVPMTYCVDRLNVYLDDEGRIVRLKYD